MTRALLASQLRDITRYLDALNKVDINLEGNEESYLPSDGTNYGNLNWGDGLRAIIGNGKSFYKIQVSSDAQVPLGYLVRYDFEWNFEPWEEEKK